jgi:hypothetical protein
VAFIYSLVSGHGLGNEVIPARLRKSIRFDHNSKAYIDMPNYTICRANPSGTWHNPKGYKPFEQFSSPLFTDG